MGIEIERKFLVKKSKWEALKKPKGNFLKQGYILTDPDKTIRVRLNNTIGTLTIKGLSIGATRQEFEYEIPEMEARQLLNEFVKSSLEKHRYEIVYKDKLWEVDEFHGDNVGLVIAEIELSNENEAFELPDWIDKEVTGDAKYYNSNLSINPYLNWRLR